MQPPRTLIEALLSAALAFGVTAALAQTTMAPADNQESANPAKAQGKRTDPSSSATDRTANAPMAGAETSGTSGDMKPHARKHRHKKSTDPAAGGASHSGAQSGSNDAATGMGNPQSGGSKSEQ